MPQQQSRNSRDNVLGTRRTAGVVVLTLRVAVEDFLDDCRANSRSSNTVTMYSNALSRLREFLGGDTPVDQIALDDLKRYLAGEQERGVSPKTLKTRRQNIQRFFHFLLDEELIDVDPSVRLRAIRVPEKAPKPVALKDVQAVLDYLNDGTLKGMRNQLLALLMVDSGGRVSEVANIVIDDIDVDRSRIRIVQKGGDEGFLNISHGTKLALMRYVRKLAQQDDPPAYLFEGPTPGKPISRTAIYKIIKEAGQNLNIAGLHPHRLRHTFASEYANSSGDALALQRELRHKNIQMSMRYTEIFGESVQRKHQQHSPASRLIVHRRRECGR